MVEAGGPRRSVEHLHRRGRKTPWTSRLGRDTVIVNHCRVTAFGQGAPAVLASLSPHRDFFAVYCNDDPFELLNSTFRADANDIQHCGPTGQAQRPSPDAMMSSSKDSTCSTCCSRRQGP